ncbi:MAG: 50S ribosomal protein L10 [Spirochaetaceae bacterium]|jgi:large subunit ribosomal protein L10|nr:50S ribosomal protein L10 [Spirochaetaceae bacterium]
MAIVAHKIQEVKVKGINELKDLFTTAPDFIFTDYRGLSVEKITELRRQLRTKGATFKVVKNNFARIAFEQLSAPDVSQYLTQPTAITIIPENFNEVAKMLLDFARDVPALKVKGGLIGQTVYTADQVEVFSKLPSRSVLIAMLMSVMNGPMQHFVVALNDVNARLVRTIKAVADKQVALEG